MEELESLFLSHATSRDSFEENDQTKPKKKKKHSEKHNADSKHKKEKKERKEKRSSPPTEEAKGMTENEEKVDEVKTTTDPHSDERSEEEMKELNKEKSEEQKPAPVERRGSSNTVLNRLLSKKLEKEEE